MRALPRKFVSLLMLAILVVSSGAYGFDGRGLTHEMEHNSPSLVVLTDRNYTPAPDTGGDPGPRPFSDTEHQLLHAAEHVQPLLLGFIGNGFGEPPANAKPKLLQLLVLPPAALEPPFRPPRITARI